MTVPNISFNILDGQLGISAGNADNVFAIVGPCSLYPTGLPANSAPIVLQGNPNQVPGLLGHGPLAEACAHILAVSGATILAMPANQTAPAAPSQPGYTTLPPGYTNSESSPPLLNVMSQLGPGGSGAQIDSYQALVEVAQGYNTLTSSSQLAGLANAAAFTYSLDGGSTVSGQITVPLSNIAPAWAANTSYMLGGLSTSATYVTNGGNTYVLVTPGKSGSSGPSGTSSSIQDGSCVWRYVGAAFPYAGIPTVSPALGSLTSGTNTGTAGPFAISDGQYWTVVFDGGSAQQIIFNATQAKVSSTGVNWSSSVNVTAGTLSFTMPNSAGVMVAVTATFAGGSTTEVTAIDTINAAIAAVGGNGYCQDSSNNLQIVCNQFGYGSTSTGAGSAIVITSNATATSLGFTSGANLAAAGTGTVKIGSIGTAAGQIPNFAAVTASQIHDAVSALTTPALTGGTLTASTSGGVTLTSAGIGASSGVEVSASTITGALGWSVNTTYSGNTVTAGQGLLSAVAGGGGAGSSPQIQLAGQVASSVTGISKVVIKVSTGGAYSTPAKVEVAYDNNPFSGEMPVNANNGVLALTGNAQGLSIVFNTGGTYQQGDTYTFATGSSFAIAEKDGTATGLVLNFPAGVYYQGDTWNFAAAAPAVSNTDLDTQIQSLINNPSVLFSGIIGVCDPLDAGTTAGKNVAALAETMDADLTTLANNFHYAFGLVCGANQPPNATYSKPADYGTALNSLGLLRTLTAGGQATIVSSLSGRDYVCNTGIPLAGRLARIPVQEHPGFVGRGPLTNVIADAQGQSDVAAFDFVRLGTVRTFIGKQGFYFSRGVTLAPNGSDYFEVQYRRVMDKACNIAYQALLPFLNDSLVTNANGTIADTQASDIEGTVSAQFASQFVNPGNAVLAGVQVSRTQNILSTNILPVIITVQPFAYAEQIQVTIGFSVPQ